MGTSSELLVTYTFPNNCVVVLVVDDVLVEVDEVEVEVVVVVGASVVVVVVVVVGASVVVVVVEVVGASVVVVVVEVVGASVVVVLLVEVVLEVVLEVVVEVLVVVVVLFNIALPPLKLQLGAIVVVVDVDVLLVDVLVVEVDVVEVDVDVVDVVVEVVVVKKVTGPVQSSADIAITSIVEPAGAVTVPDLASKVILGNLLSIHWSGPSYPSHSVQLTQPAVFPFVTLYM